MSDCFDFSNFLDLRDLESGNRRSAAKQSIAEVLDLLACFAKELSLGVIRETILTLNGEERSESEIGSVAEEDHFLLEEMVRFAKPRQPPKLNCFVTSPAEYRHLEVCPFDSKASGSTNIVTYHGCLVRYVDPSRFFLAIADEAAGQEELLRKPSGFWFPALRYLKEEMPCLLYDEERKYYRRAKLRTFCANGKGSFILADEDRCCLAPLKNAYLIPKRIFSCPVKVFLVRMSFIRPIYEYLWAVDAVNAVRQYLTGKPLEIAFTEVDLEAGSGSVYVNNGCDDLMDLFVKVDGFLLDVEEMVAFWRRGFLGRLIPHCKSALKRMQDAVEQDGQSRRPRNGKDTLAYELTSKKRFTDDRFVIPVSLIYYFVQMHHHAVVSFFRRNGGAEDFAEWYTDYLRCKDNIGVVCKVLVEERLSLTDHPKLCYIIVAETV